MTTQAPNTSEVLHEEFMLFHVVLHGILGGDNVRSRRSRPPNQARTAGLGSSACKSMIFHTVHFKYFSSIFPSQEKQIFSQPVRTR